MDSFVLAGGRSTRMGVDKARVPYPGPEPMAVTLARTLSVACERVALVRRGPADGLPWELEGSSLMVIRDRGEGAPHPLHGIAAGLRAARSEHVLFVSCDVPHLTVADVRALQVGEPCVAFDGERVHPLVAVYPRSWADRAEAMAGRGASVRSFAEGLRRITLQAASLANFNRWSEVGRPGPVRALLSRLGALGDEERIAAGELARLAAAGVMDPEQSIRYARLLRGGTR